MPMKPAVTIITNRARMMARKAVSGRSEVVRVRISGRRAKENPRRTRSGPMEAVTAHSPRAAMASNTGNAQAHGNPGWSMVGEMEQSVVVPSRYRVLRRRLIAVITQRTNPNSAAAETKNVTGTGLPTETGKSIT